MPATMVVCLITPSAAGLETGECEKILFYEI